MKFEQARQDLRLAWRGLRRTPGITAPAVLTLAVGMAGATAMFTLVQGVLLRRLPVAAQDRLLVGWKESAAAGFSHWPFRMDEVRALAERSQSLESVAGVGYNGVAPTITLENGLPGLLQTASVTGGFFRVLGVPPLLGRALRPEDDVIGADNVLVLSRSAWRRRHGAAPDVIGRRLVISERAFTIVGVMPDVAFPPGAEAWMTLAADASTMTNPAFREGVLRDVDLLARLRPGATLAQAAQELDALAPHVAAQSAADSPAGLRPALRPYEDVVVGDVRPGLLVLFGAVGLVWLIAGANVANLLLLRGQARQSELALRAALGAGRGRLARLVVAESVLLALAAGVMGTVAAGWMLEALLAAVPDTLPRSESVRLDAGVLLFSAATALATALLAGLAPALYAMRTDLVSVLRAGGRGVTGRLVGRGRRALVVAQVALAVTVVAAAGLLTRSLVRLQSVDLGLAADRLVFVPLALPSSKYADGARHARFLDETLAQLASAPGIAAATAVSVPPFAGTRGWDVGGFTLEGESAGSAAGHPSLSLEAVLPSHFATFEVALAHGRAFTADDRAGTPPVAILSHDAAARLWPGGDALGKRLKFGGGDSRDPWRTVVGVARPTRYRELARARPTLYVPAAQFINAADTLVVRTAAPLTAVAGLVRDRVRAVDPDVMVLRVAPFRDLLRAPLARPRFNAFLIGVFGAVALVLAATGLYAVMAAHVRQRQTEIGIRLALGATAVHIKRLVLSDGLRLAGIGAVAGLAGAVAAARLVRALLFEVHPLDPASLLAAAALLIGVAALASYGPARRAAGVDPTAMMRRD